MQYYDLFPDKSNGIKIFYKSYIMLFCNNNISSLILNLCALIRLMDIA